MKNYLKIIVMTFSLLLFMNIYAFADSLPSNIRLEGNAKGIMFIPGDEKFLYKENMVPGDEVDRTMTINNKYDAPFDLYMRAERITEKEQYDLLDKLQLKITYKGKVIYTGPVSGEDGLIKDISLGTYKPGEKGDLKAEVVWDQSKEDNEYKNKVAEVNWIFTAQSKGSPQNNPTQPHTGDSGLWQYIIVLLGAVIILVAISMKKTIGKEV